MMFEKNLKKLRKENNLTQGALADRLGVSRQAICMWEQGERTPKLGLIMEIARIFKVSIDYMIKGRLADGKNN